MAQVTISIPMDEGLKKDMEQVCKELGISTDTAFNTFAKKLIREKRIPFDVSADSSVPQSK